MSSTDGEIGMRDLTDKATYERLEKDVAAVKNDISALTDQITDALNAFAGTARKQASRGYKQARANVDSAMEDASERGSAIMGAAQDAAEWRRLVSLFLLDLLQGDDELGDRRRPHLLGGGELAEGDGAVAEHDHGQRRQLRRGKARRVILAAQPAQQVDRRRVQPVGHRRLGGLRRGAAFGSCGSGRHTYTVLLS